LLNDLGLTNGFVIFCNASTTVFFADCNVLPTLFNVLPNSDGGGKPAVVVVVVVAGCAVCPDVLGIVLGIVFGSVVVVVVLLGAGISVLVKVLGDIVNEESVLLSLIYNNCLYLYIYAIIYLVLFSINLRLIKNMKSIQKL
jgi:hypothetical protein